MSTRRGIANKLDRVGVLLAQVTAELREPEPMQHAGNRSTQDLVEAIYELAERIARLEEAAKQPERTAYRPREVADMTGLGYGAVLSLVHSGELESVKVGRLHVVPRAAVEALIARTGQVIELDAGT